MMKHLPLCLLLAASTFASAQNIFTTHTPPENFAVRGMDDNPANGSILLATDKGLYSFNGSWQKFSTGNGLPDNDVKCISVSLNGIAYLGFGNKKAGSVTSGLGQYADFKTNIGAPYDYISAIRVSNADTMLGTNKGTLHVLKKGSSYTYTGTLNGEVRGLNKATNIPSIGTFFLAPTSRGYLISDAFSHTSEYLQSNSPLPSNNLLSNDVVGSVSYDGTDRGFFSINYGNYPNIAPTIYNRSNTPTLPSDTVQAILWANGELWLGTPNGLAKKVGNTWTVYTTANSNLPNNNVVKLLHANDKVWIATADGKLSETSAPLGINSISRNTENLVCYPNPAGDEVTVSFSLKNAVNLNIELHDMLGNIVKSVPAQEYPGGLNNLNLDIAGVKAGCYFIVLDSGGNKITQRLLVD